MGSSMKTGINSFDVLDRNLQLRKNYLLEASAGTGKTFSIENIVVRLLICENPINLEDILVVTFTKAATRDLRSRIRSNIEKILQALRTKSTSIDFVKALIENGEGEIAERRLKMALLTYDQSHIYTIHQFCYRMLRDYVLEGNYSMESVSGDNPLPRTYLLTIIRDYFRTEVRNNAYSKAQLNLLLEDHGNSMIDLENAILNTVTKGMDIEEQLSYHQQLEKFKCSMKNLKEIYGFSKDYILEDFMKLSSCYKQICNVKKQIKPEVIKKVESFATLFDKNSWDADDFEQVIEDQLYMVKLYDPNNKQAKAKFPESGLHFPEMRNLLMDALLDCVSVQIVFARMAFGCRKLLKKHLLEEEKLGFDELLEAARAAIGNSNFANAVREKFKAAIVDEFQDTDPVQWEIFNRLFLSSDKNWGNLYLVGDPKQSIYAFRQADIYTYIDAGNAIGEDNHSTLDTNFRSQSSLIMALNALFNSNNCPGFINLPKIEKSLPFQEVKCPLEAKEKTFSDQFGSVHFCMANEESLFLPFITHEIQKLNGVDGISFKEFSILVSDRYQAQRVSEFLREWNIPCMTQRSSSLAESEALSTFRDLLKAVLAPNHESSLKTALGGRMIGWTDDKVKKLDQLELLQEVLTRFYTMRTKLFKEGFYPFFEYFMGLSWDESLKTVREELLLQQSGLEFYQDLIAIVEVLLDEQTQNTLSPSGLLKFLDDFKVLAQDEDERMKRPLDNSQDAVNIITIHSSKGLEFGVVFTLGLIKNTRAPDLLIPLVRNQKRMLVPITHIGDSEYIQHCQEIDAEKMRQLYVAMTRAKFRLYCPVMVSEKEKVMDIGTASPMQLFLEKIGHLNLETLSPYITTCCINDSEFKLEILDSNVEPVLNNPIKMIIPGSSQYIHSFTSLSKHHAKEFYEFEAPRDFNNLIKTPHTLPSGSDTGNLLHSILENFCWGQSIESHVKACIQGTAYQEWEPVISNIILNAYQYRFSDGFSLSEIDHSRSFKETEFMYPYESNFLKGIIDFVFEHKGKYYIIDWKSNYLGPDCTYYSNERLMAAMDENNYFFQAQLYEDALRKYLKVLDKRDFKDIFGGTYYLFLRGIDSTSNTSYGVFKC